jgi:hypothetical protein
LNKIVLSSVHTKKRKKYRNYISMKKIPILILITIILIALIYFLFIADLRIKSKNEEFVISTFDNTELLDTGDTYSFLSANWQSIMYALSQSSNYEQNTKLDEEMFGIHSFARLLDRSGEFDFVLTRDIGKGKNGYPSTSKSDILNELLLGYFIYSCPQKYYSTWKRIFINNKRKGNYRIYTLSTFLAEKITEQYLPTKVPLVSFSDSIYNSYMIQEYPVTGGKTFILINFSLSQKSHIRKEEWARIKNNIQSLMNNKNYILAAGSCNAEKKESESIRYDINGMNTLAESVKSEAGIITEYIIYSKNIDMSVAENDWLTDIQKNNLMYYQFRFKE